MEITYLASGKTRSGLTAKKENQHESYFYTLINFVLFIALRVW